MKENYFGKNLKELRESKSLSQRKLGEALGVSNQSVSFWETGQREPDIDMLISIADYFGVSIDFLCGRTEY